MISGAAIMAVIQRDITTELKILLSEYPVVTVLGPRQAGKTTLVKQFIEGYEYSNLEQPETRDFAENDPKAYLAQFDGRVIIDEIQRVPKLLSYIQATVDDREGNGQFILTGSHQLQLQEAVTQSLAGRTAMLTLLPLSIHELASADIHFSAWHDYCFNGFLPRVYAQKQRPAIAYSNYYQTYVERDVRQIINLKEAGLFEKFMKLMAGRVGQVINYSSLANDTGVDIKTIKHWLSILEASFILFKLPPYFENLGKRAIKSPKFYFNDVGLLCFLLNIEQPEQVTRDPLVGSLFENMMVVECIKQRLNSGKRPNLYFYRDSNGNEVDVLFEEGGGLVAIEIKSAATFSTSQLKSLKKISDVTERVKRMYLIYNGEEKQLSQRIQTVNFQNVASIFR